MTQSEKEPLEVLLRKHLERQPEINEGNKDCPEPDLVAAYFERSLSPALQSTLERHVASCSRCQDELAFLLKTFPTEPQAQPSIELSPFRKVIDWLGFTRPGPFVLKPVFALALIALVSGILGYRVILEQKHSPGKETEIAESIGKTAEPPTFMPEAADDRRIQEKGDEARDAASPSTDVLARKGKSTIEPGRRRLDQTPDSQSPGAGNAVGGAQEVQTTPSKASSENERAEAIPQAMAKQPSEEEPRKEVATNLPALSVQEKALSGGTPASVPPAAPVANQVAMEQDSVGKDQAVLKDKKVEGQPQMGKFASGQLGGVAALARSSTSQKQKDIGSEKSVSASTADESKKESRTSHALLTSSSQSRLMQVSGKTFELRENVWVDLETVTEKEFAPLVIRRGSSEYQALEKELSSYREILDRPEDCVIKLKEKIYRITRK
ncbi:MAG: zf-HC2 domain-containing protein [Terriglobia bacterium]